MPADFNSETNSFQAKTEEARYQCLGHSNRPGGGWVKPMIEDIGLPIAERLEESVWLSSVLNYTGQSRLSKYLQVYLLKPLPLMRSGLFGVVRQARQDNAAFEVFYCCYIFL